jgi:chromosome segregation ATPase
LQAHLQTIDLDLASKREQVKALSEQVRDLPEDQRKEIEAHPLYVEGERLAAAYRSSMDSASSTLSSGQVTIQKVLSELPAVVKALPSGELSAVREKVSEKLNEVVSQLEVLTKSLEVLREDTKADFERIAQEIVDHRGKYDAAASENTVVQERLGSLRTISDQIAQIEKDRDSLLRKIAEVADAGKALGHSRKRWLDTIIRRNELLERQAVTLTRDSGGELQAKIERGQNIEYLKGAIQDAIRGAGITIPDKFDNLLGAVVANPDPLAAWLEVGDELIALGRVGPQLPLGADLPTTPKEHYII